MDEDSPAERQRRLDDVRRRLETHPGFREHQLLDAMARTLQEVFQSNCHELMLLLDKASTDKDLAVELIQNVHEDSVRQRFHALTSQRLHNYLASTMSLVEHSRRLMRNRTGAIAEAYEARKAELLSHGEVRFMIDLRSFTQHRALPRLGHTLRIADPNQESVGWHSEVQLFTEELLQWDKWSAPSRRFLVGQPEGGLPLRPVVRRHAELVFSFNAWLYDVLAEANTSALNELNTLVVEANAALLGCSFEQAREFTDRRERERRLPASEVNRIHGPPPEHAGPDDITARIL